MLTIGPVVDLKAMRGIHRLPASANTTCLRMEALGLNLLVNLRPILSADAGGQHRLAIGEQPERCRQHNGGEQKTVHQLGNPLNHKVLAK